ncbi:MAG: DNA polymerase I [Treponema sp.]|nr:DNA polymerase I [Treponema sp.]
MENASKKTVYILDSYGLIYRAYFALVNHPLTNGKGQNISAVVIFFRNLKALLSKYNPQFLAAAFDSRTPTFRHEMYAEYKATRQKTPEDLHAQVPIIESILTAMNIPVLRVDGFEADDIIATVAEKCKKEGFDCRILSGDKDLLQLVTETCKEMQPDKANGGWETNGVDEVITKWGIPPEKILDYLSLVGDSADNIPGIKGVGDKTALKLLTEYGDLDGILFHADEIKGAIGNKVRDGKDSAVFSRNLIRLRNDVPIDIAFEQFSTQSLDFNAAGKLLHECGAFTVAKSFLTSEPDTTEVLQEQEKTVRKNEASYRPCTDIKELKSFIDSVLQSQEKNVAFDSETDSLNAHSAHLVGFSLCCKTGEALYVPVILPGGMFSEKTIDKKDCIEQLSRLLDNTDVTLIMHNGKFDLEVLFANGYRKMPDCKIVDTMIAAWLLNPDALGKSPYGLEYLGETKLGLKGTEFNDIVKKGETFADVPLEKAFPYGAEDADFTWQLWQIFKKQLAEEKLEDLFYNMEMNVLPILTEMEIQGIHLDKQALNDYSKELAQAIEKQKQIIYEQVGHTFNIASTQQLQQVLFEERGLIPGKKTKHGYSTDTAVLEELSERTTDPLPKEILAYRSATKLQSTYVETLPTLADKTGRIHTSFLQTGTATGRLSSRDPNLQNIPVRDDAGRKIRAAFTAVPGTVLISADYAQIELVVLAHLSNDKNLCKAFKEGIDVHKSTAALIYNVAPDAVTPDMRRFAKTVNFGVMYGMSAFRLANELGISRTEAKNFIDQYFDTYADVKRFINETIAFAQAHGYSQTIMGRKRMIPGINSKNKLEQQGAQRVAINTPIQGSAADIVKKAMIQVQAALKTSHSPAKMLLQVHDELIFECPDEETIKANTIQLIKTEMEHAVALNVPLKVSIESGINWGEFH